MVVIHSKNICKSCIVFTKTPMALTADVTCVLLKARFAFYWETCFTCALETQSCFELGSQLLLDLSEADAICVLLVLCLILHVCFLEQGYFLLVRS